MAAKSSTDVVGYMEDAYAKLPNLPAGARDFIVSITPWLSLIFGLLIVLASLSAFGVLAVFSPFAAMGGGVGLTAGLMLSAVLGVAEGVLMLLAFPPLRRKQAKGWTLLFWSEVLGVVGTIVTLQLTGIVGALIAFYFLFQIKPYYK